MGNLRACCLPWKSVAVSQAPSPESNLIPRHPPCDPQSYPESPTSTGRGPVGFWSDKCTPP
ncbi:unnamed protein product [Clavelina lepadiformis]|uniref:Uncharacterized protein n=1 Tax=Clavelina lepadiformis TaxID=159417 RepID=A0ABP0G1D1_CLALP